MLCDRRLNARRWCHVSTRTDEDKLLGAVRIGFEAGMNNHVPQGCLRARKLEALSAGDACQRLVLNTDEACDGETRLPTFCRNFLLNLLKMAVASFIFCVGDTG